MSQSDEATLEEATKTVDAATTAGHRFKAIRSSNQGAENRTEIIQLRVDEDFTYRDLEALLARLPPPGTPRCAAVPAGTDYGFLAAVTNLMHDSLAEPGGPRRGAAPTRRYPYAGRLYSITLREAVPLDTFTAGARTYRAVVDGAFQVTNLATRTTTDFRIVYGAREALRERPICVVYRPHWWLELELLLKD